MNQPQLNQVDAILQTMTRYLVPAGWGEQNVNLKKRETSKALAALHKVVIESLPKRIEVERGDWDRAKLVGYSQAIDDMKAKLNELFGVK